MPDEPKGPPPGEPGGASPDDILKKKFLEDDPLGLFGVQDPPAPSKAPAQEGPPSPATSPPVSPIAPPVTGGTPSGGAGLDLDHLLREPPPPRPPFPKASPERSLGTPSGFGSPKDGEGRAEGEPPRSMAKRGSLPLRSVLPPSAAGGPVRRIAVTRGEKVKAALAACLDALSRLTRLPRSVVAVLLACLFLAAVAGITVLASGPPVRTVDAVVPLHLVRVQSRDMADMDVPAYLEMDRRLRELGFQPLLQFTVPQLPSANFLDVRQKPEAQTYGVLLVFPGSSMPKLAFVTPFSDGVWFATNGWAGKDVSEDYRLSRHFPDLPPDRLYAQHLQDLARLRAERGMDPQPIRESRYIGAFTDHLREFLARSGTPPYQADPALWH